MYMLFTWIHAYSHIILYIYIHNIACDFAAAFLYDSSSEMKKLRKFMRRVDQPLRLMSSSYFCPGITMMKIIKPIMGGGFRWLIRGVYLTWYFSTISDRLMISERESIMMIRTGNPFLRPFFITAGWPRTKNPSEFEGTFEKGACNGREVPYGFLKLGRKIPENSSRFIRFLETKTTTSTTNCCTTICDIPGRPGPRIPKDWEG